MEEKNQSTLIYILIAVIIVLVIFSVYFFFGYNHKKSNLVTNYQTSTSTPSASASVTTSTPSTSPSNSATENISTYTNDNFKYTFSYPNAWKVSDRCYNKSTNKWEDYNPKQWLAIVANTTDDKFPMCESDFPQTNLIVRASVTPVDINGQMEQSDTDIESEELINGVTWAKQIYTEADEFDGAYVTYLYNNHNGTGYIISYPNTDAKGTHNSQIDEIINSFKFYN